MRGFVYTGKLDEKALVKLMEEIFENKCFYICQEIDRYELGEGLPEEICSEGRAFSDEGEVRWEKNGEEYHVVLLVEKQISKIPPGLIQDNREWTLEEKLGEVYLVNLGSSQISPKFSKYPKNAEKLSTKIYLKKNVPTFISLRGFK
jgi:hypothetical protein